jgi:hypothetical protein
VKPTTATAVLIARSISESELQGAVIELAHTSGWLVHHTRAARSRKGWRTPIQGDAGFCDLVLAKNGCVLFAELKSERGRVSPEQQAWIRALDGERQGALLPGQRRVLRPVCDGGWISIVVWRPSDWLSGEIAELLTGHNGRNN